MNQHLRQCPICGERTLFRKACGEPEWSCDWCLEMFTDLEIAEYDREPVWEYNRENGDNE